MSADMMQRVLEQNQKLLELLTVREQQPARVVVDPSTQFGTYDGTSAQKAEDWLTEVKRVVRLAGWKDADVLLAIQPRLTDSAKYWYLATGVGCKTFAEFENAFRKAF